MELNLKEDELEGNHLVISCTINKNSSNIIPTHTLINCSATGYAFVDDEFACYHSLPRYYLKTERELEVIDRRPIKSGNITHITKISLFINGHKERLPAFIMHLGHYPLVLGKPWLKRHDVSIQFATDIVRFYSLYCLNNCTEHAVLNKGITIDPLEHISTALPALPAPPMPPLLSMLPLSSTLSAPPIPTSPLLIPSIAMISAATF